MTAAAARTGGLVGPMIGAALVTALGWAVGLSVLNAVAVGVAVVTVYGLRHLTASSAGGWSPRAEEVTERGARRDVTRLSWSLRGFEDRVHVAGVRRLHGVAAGRLARSGLQLDCPDDAEACRRLLGDPAYRLLVGTEDRPPDLPAFDRAVTAVERLTAPEDRRTPGQFGGRA